MKLKAVNEKTTISVLITKALNQLLIEGSKPKKLVDKGPESTHRLGVFKLGITQVYKHRADLYDEHLKRKMGY